jgi:uncharacterized protein (DUF58 family)
MTRHLLRPEVLAGLSNLELVARAAVHGVMTGLHRSPTFGFSQEFAEYRAYAEGDDPRFVDWNVYARTDRTYIKRFLGETNTQLTILLDISGSMGYGSGAVSKLQYGKFLAATLAYIASHQHDAVGLMLFDDEVREFRPPSARGGKLTAILHTIDRASPGARTDLAAPFQRFRQHVRRRGMVAVISDFYCAAETLVENVRPLAYQGQDVILFQLLDPQELRPERRQPTLLEDIETGEAFEVSPDYLQGPYRERIRAHVGAIRDAAARIGADHFQIDIADPLDSALRDYLLFRQRRGLQ